MTRISEIHYLSRIGGGVSSIVAGTGLGCEVATLSSPSARYGESAGGTAATGLVDLLHAEALDAWATDGGSSR